MDRVAAGAERGLHDERRRAGSSRRRAAADARPRGRPAARRGRPGRRRTRRARLEPELPARAHDAHGDLAAVGDEHALDPLTRRHPEQRLRRTRPARRSRPDLDDRARHAGGDRVHHLHDLDDAHVVSGSTRAPTSTNGGARAPRRGRRSRASVRRWWSLRPVRPLTVAAGPAAVADAADAPGTSRTVRRAAPPQHVQREPVGLDPQLVERRLIDEPQDLADVFVAEGHGILAAGPAPNVLISSDIADAGFGFAARLRRGR